MFVPEKKNLKTAFIKHACPLIVVEDYYKV